MNRPFLSRCNLKTVAVDFAGRRDSPVDHRGGLQHSRRLVFRLQPLGKVAHHEGQRKRAGDSRSLKHHEFPVHSRQVQRDLPGTGGASTDHLDLDYFASLPTQGEDPLGVVEGSDLEPIEVPVLAAEPGVLDHRIIVALGQRKIEARIDADPGGVIVPGDLFSLGIENQKHRVQSRGDPAALHLQDDPLPFPGPEPIDVAVGSLQGPVHRHRHRHRLASRRGVVGSFLLFVDFGKLTHGEEQDVGESAVAVDANGIEAGGRVLPDLHQKGRRFHVLGRGVRGPAPPAA